ncbi:MAG TPA: hypothetical protein VF240_20810 [Pyrinomonadaceae bacterium]
MSSATIIRRLCSSLLIIILAFTSAPLAAQDKSKNKKKKPTPRGTPVLWRAPADIESRDLALGPGGAEMRPNLRRITFLKKQEGGWSTKFRVRDASGREWVAKVGKEAQSETAAVRLVWAAGYLTEINYLAPCVRIEGAPAPGKDDEQCEGGGFANVRFEARPKGVKRLDPWEWKKNPFKGTRELQGLIVLMGLINNWDLKDTNNVVLAAPGARGRTELQYVISDLGATFGKTGSLPLFWRVTRSRNDPEGFSKDKFVDEVEDGKVSFHFTGKNRGLFEDITVRDARWIGGWLSRLSERQIGDAFRAANYAPDEVQMLTDAVRRRVGELTALRGRGAESGDAGGRRR